MARAPGIDRKEQIVSAAIARLFAVGFEGLRVGDVARDVGINNATLVHHFPTKVALIRAVVERFTGKFEAVADSTNAKGPARTRLARHVRSSVALMRASPEMFGVLNEIMIRARRDAEIANLVAVPLAAWRHHILSLLLPPETETGALARRNAGEIATVCMAQLLGMGLLLSATAREGAGFRPVGGRTEAMAVAAVTRLVKDTP